MQLLTEDQVYKADLRGRMKTEKTRLDRIEKDKTEELNNTVLSKEENVQNKDRCMRCLAGFIFLLRRRRQCDSCFCWVCKACSKWEKTIKIYVCNVCEKKVALAKEQSDWFYQNVFTKLKFGSTRVLRPRSSRRKKKTSHSLSRRHSDVSRKSLFAINWKDQNVNPTNQLAEQRTKSPTLETAQLETNTVQLQDATRTRELRLPTFDIDDDGALDPDLLAMGGEDEQLVSDPGNIAQWEVESNLSSVSMRSWKANWFFKEKNFISPYDNVGHKAFHSNMADSMMMFVPEVDTSKVQIGDRDAERMSELSENDSQLSALCDNDEGEDKICEDLNVETDQHRSEITDGESDEELDLKTCFFSGEQGALSMESNIDGNVLDGHLQRTILSARARDRSMSKQLTLLPSAAPTPFPRKSSMDLPYARGNLGKDTGAVHVSNDSTAQRFVEPRERSSDIKLNVKSKTVSVSEGQTAKLTIEISNKESTDVFWYKEFGNHIQQLKHSEKYEMLETGNTCCLEIYDCSVEDYGHYICIAANENDSSKWLFELNLREGSSIGMSRPEFIRNINDLERIEGQNANFRVKVKGVPHPRVLWYKDGCLLEDSSMYRIERVGNRDYTLTLDNLTLDHDAEYMVIATNRLGRVKTVVQLIVEPKQEEDEAPNNSKTKLSAPPKTSPQDTVTKNVISSKITTLRTIPRQKEDQIECASGLMTPDSAIYSMADIDSEQNREDLIRRLSDMDVTASALKVSQSAENIKELSNSRPREGTKTRLSSVNGNVQDVNNRVSSKIKVPVQSPISQKQSTLNDLPRDAEKSYSISTQVERHEPQIVKVPAKITSDELSKQCDSRIVDHKTDIRDSMKPQIDLLDYRSHDLVASDDLFVNCGLKRVDSKRYNRDYIVNRSPNTERKELRGMSPLHSRSESVS